MFGLIKEKEFSPNISETLVSDAPVLIDGADVIESLCPVNPITGRPDSVVNIMYMAMQKGGISDPAKARLLDAIAVELPAIQSVDADDDAKLDLLVSRLDQGSFAERDVLVDSLSKVTDVLFPKNAETSDKKISFVENTVENASANE